MDEIKIKFYLKQIGSEEIIVKIFDYSAIFSGTAKKYFKEQLSEYFIIGKGFFIGCFGKKGEEIYSHDIVNHRPYKEKIYSVGVVEYSNSHAHFFIKNNHGTGTRINETQEIELIGNRFQDLNLIKL